MFSDMSDYYDIVCTQIHKHGFRCGLHMAAHLFALQNPCYYYHEIFVRLEVLARSPWGSEQ